MRLPLLATVLLCSACSSLPRSTCPVGAQALIEDELFFGLSTPGGGTISEAQWQAFLRDEVTPRFPQGLSVVDAAGQWRGNDGSITIGRPTQETRVDVRRAEVELLVEHAVAMTIITSDEPLRLILTGTPAFFLDAAASDAGIQATEFDLKPEVAEADSKLSHQFGAKSDVRITLRNTRGEIILRKNK